jgi:hypothetical protein
MRVCASQTVFSHGSDLPLVLNFVASAFLQRSCSRELCGSKEKNAQFLWIVVILMGVCEAAYLLGSHVSSSLFLSV